jgi:hypothetical protein
MIIKAQKAMMIFTILVCAWDLWVNLGCYLAFSNFRTNPTEELGRLMVSAGDLSDQVRIYVVFCFLGTFVTNILATNILYNRARPKIAHFDLLSKYSKKRAVGSWFIPLGNLLLPRKRLNELEQILRPDNLTLHDESQFNRRNKLGDYWWYSWVAFIILINVAVSYYEPLLADESDSDELFRILNNYLVGVSIASSLLILSMILGFKYFDYLFGIDATSSEQ